MRRLLILMVPAMIVASLTGCTNRKLLNEKDREIEAKDQTIVELQAEITRLTQEREHVDQLNDDLQAALSSLQDEQKLSLSSDNNQSMITLPNAVTFASGSALLTPEGKAIIDKIWEVLSRYPDRRILVEGHTDNVPIAPEWRDVFRSNWELSSARALAVVHHVRAKFKTNPERLAAVGCGEYRPVADNSTEAGKAQNRRVVVIVARPDDNVATGR